MQTINNFNKWMVIAIVLTIGYFIFLYFATTITIPIRECSSNGVVANWFGCITMNELGDFFAGAFAPVAFIWLVAAVLIQSQELRAQREELEQNREVMLAQAAEARKQADYIGEQTQLLKSEQKYREEEKATDTFQASIRMLATRLRSNPKFCIEDGGSHEIGFKIASLIIETEDSYQMISNVTLLLQDLFFEILSRGSKVSMAEPNGFRNVLKAGNSAIKQYTKLPEIAKIDADTLGLKTFQFLMVGVGCVASNVDDIEFAIDEIRDYPEFNKYVPSFRR